MVATVIHLERGGGVVSAPMMIEPLPEQGSGPRDAEQPGPAVFIDDDWDEGGWEENSWEDESWAELTGESEPRVPAPEPRALQAALQELRESYVIVRSEQSFFFGRLDGPSLKDAHQCDTKGDIVAAYKSLLVHHQEQRRGERRSQILGIQGDWLPESLDQAILEQAVVEWTGNDWFGRIWLAVGSNGSISQCQEIGAGFGVRADMDRMLGRDPAVYQQAGPHIHVPARIHFERGLYAHGGRHRGQWWSRSGGMVSARWLFTRL